MRTGPFEEVRSSSLVAASRVPVEEKSAGKLPVFEKLSFAEGAEKCKEILRRRALDPAGFEPEAEDAVDE